MYKCECDQKGLCTKMLKASIRELMKNLKRNKNNSYTILDILGCIETTFEEYKVCIPCAKLQNKAREISKKIVPSSAPLYKKEKILINSYIAELEVFVND